MQAIEPQGSNEATAVYIKNNNNDWDEMRCDL